MNVLVEGFEPDALAVASLLAREGARVRLAGSGDLPPAAVPLRMLGVELAPGVDLDADPGSPLLAYLDVWTPETAPRVVELRRRGTRVSCASELVLERARAVGARTVGITGTAGKTTAASFAAQLLRATGVAVRAASDGRLGNLWATGELVGGLVDLTPAAVVLVELTSSHLAFMRSSPDVAVITSFWPDHVELHGSVDAYRAAKETIVRHQRPDGAVVVGADDEATAPFTTLTPAARYSWSRVHSVSDGAFVRDGALVARCDGEEAVLGPAFGPTVVVEAMLAATAAALAVGGPVPSLVGVPGELVVPAHRQQPKGEVAGVTIVDDGMATTPAKAQSALSGRPDRSVVLIAGGRLTSEGGAVHASAEEQALLATCCDEVGRAARHAVLFGEAAALLAHEMEQRGVPTSVVSDLRDAVAAALRQAPGAETVVFAPIYPLPAADRARFPALVEETAAASRVRDSRP